MTSRLPDTFRSDRALDDLNDLEPWIGYVRVSTWREEKISPELQKAAIEAWAQRTRRRIVKWIVDLDATGRNFRRRIMIAIEGVEGGEAKGIAVWKFSRFGRDRAGVALNLARLERVGGQLESATEDVDASTATGRFNRDILFAVAAMESDRAGEQWKDAHQWRRAHGLPATGGKRLGYIWHPRRLPDPDRPGEWLIQQERYEIDPDAAPHVEALYDRKTRGEAFAVLAGWLNGLGYRNSRGELWREDTVRRYMDAGFPAGMLRIHDPECRCDYSTNGHRCNRWLHIEGAHDPIITPEQWEKYLEHRAHTKATAPRARKATYPLTGLIRCGRCRGYVAATSARRAGQTISGFSYSCQRHRASQGTVCPYGLWIKRETVEGELLRWLTREVAPDVDALPAMPQPRRDIEQHRANLARERARLEAEAKRLADALARLRADRMTNPEEYGPGEYEATRDRIRQQQETNAHALAALDTEQTEPDRADYEPLIVGLIEEWDTLPTLDKNAILRQLLRRVVCTRVRLGDPETRIEVHPVWEPDPWAASQ